MVGDRLLCALFPRLSLPSTLKFHSVASILFLGTLRPFPWLLLTCLIGSHPLWPFYLLWVIFLFLRAEKTHACGTVVILKGFAIAISFDVG